MFDASKAVSDASKFMFDASKSVSDASEFRFDASYIDFWMDYSVVAASESAFVTAPGRFEVGEPT